MFGFGLPELIISLIVLVLPVAGLAILIFVVVMVIKNKKTSVKEELKFCSKCGNKIDVNMTKCPNCGPDQSYFGETLSPPAGLQ